MELAGDERSEALLKSHGLIARIPSGPVTAALVPMSGFLYAGTRSGELLKIDVENLAVVQRENVPADIAELEWKDDQLWRTSAEGRREMVVAVAHSAAPVAPAEDGSVAIPPPATLSSSPPGLERWSIYAGAGGPLVTAAAGSIASMKTFGQPNG
jgi:hypothetical protein